MKVIVISNALKTRHKEKIESVAAKAGYRICFCEKESEVPDDFADAEIIYGNAPSIVRTSHNLKWLCMPFAGVDSLLKPGAFANEECILTNSSGAYGVSIAEHIIAVSLMMMRKLTVFYSHVLQGEWISPRPQKSLKDCRITVLGTGDIGTCFAKRARSFEPAKIVGVCRSGKADDTCYDSVVTADKLDQILPDTDLLVMSLPDTPQTVNIMSGDRLALLPKEAYIVNVGRGSAIDEEALADLLDKEMLAGAALDVFRTEPLPKDSRLWKTKNLLITPHVAGNLTVEHTLDKNVDMFCEDLENYASGRPLVYLVDRKKGY